MKNAIEKELSGLLERRQNRGMSGAKTQVMLCGIPNVGKSTFINTFAGSARAKAADRPGVTKGKQWVSTDKFDLLDMPGVLWKKFDSKTIASNLAFIGSIKDDILDVEELAMNLLDEVRRNYPDLVAQRYKLDAETMALPPYELMEAIGRKRGLLVRGGEVVCFPGLGISLILLSGVQVLQVELFLAQLAPGDLLIFRAGGHELRVSALAHQPAIVQHQDLIGVEDGGNALCHDDHSGIVSFFLQRTAQGDIRLVVKGREAVVEQIDLWILGNGTVPMICCVSATGRMSPSGATFPAGC